MTDEQRPATPIVSTTDYGERADGTLAGHRLGGAVSGNVGDTEMAKEPTRSCDKMWAVICDIDGTIANIEHRLHHIMGKPPDWPTFFAAAMGDSPKPEVIHVFHALQDSGLLGIIVTGRPEDNRELTVSWLARHHVEYSGLFMRPEGDHRPDLVIKSEILDYILANGFMPRVVLDDRNQVVDMWRSRGLTCLQVQAGNY